VKSSSFLLLFSINISSKNYINLLKIFICCLHQSNKIDHFCGIEEFHEFHYIYSQPDPSFLTKTVGSG